MKSYFDTLKKSDCNGCGTCSLKCPKKAITMEYDSEGFLYPVVDKEKCINCGICKKVCSSGKDYDMNAYKNSDTYISYTKNKEDKKNSSSGGMFFPLVRYVIEEKKGVVFGVETTKDLLAKHSYAETLEDAKKYQGSKYVKSDLNNSYTKVKEFLNDNRIVLFSGTPCQCAGLRSFLGKEYDNLITCEIICHANPSPRIYSMYLESIEKKYNKKIKMIYFRSKETGWRNQTPLIEFTDGSKMEENTFFYAFTSELLNRESCYECRFSSMNRYSDFTIGDFWGIEKYDSEIKDDDTGISLLCVNTDKGKDIFKNIEKNLFVKKADIVKAFSYNHNKNIKKTFLRKLFFKRVEKEKINNNNLLFKIKIYSFFNKILNKINKKICKKK